MDLKGTREIISIIPQPLELDYADGSFVLDNNTIISYDNSLHGIARVFNKFLSRSTGFNLLMKPESQDKIRNNGISLKLDSILENLGQEGYSIKITKNNIRISANSPCGIFYGFQTLRQLFPTEIENHSIMENINWAIPCLSIRDSPRFSWRGFMLDEGRHFHGKEIVKKILEIMASLKLNIFHWHLTEDQGWRIQIKKYPKLTELGSKRTGTQILKLKDLRKNRKDENPHEGYYSQEDIKEIINFASERFIKIIPEIEMPGHTMAALSAYPEMSCTGGPFKVQESFGIKKDVYCPGKEQVFEFIQNILDEIIELFDSKIIHIGGDEVPKDRWKDCSDCQERIKTEKLGNEEDLQVYFTNRIASYLSAHGQKIMGWNQILKNNLSEDVICQYWMLGKKEFIGQLKQGRKAVMSNFFHTYLDYDYNLTPLRKTYRFEPIPKKLRSKYSDNFLGIEAPLWTERIPNLKRLEWHIFPRLIAIAETGWTIKENKSYKSFKKRLTPFLKRLDYYNVNYAKKPDPNFIKRIIGNISFFFFGLYVLFNKDLD